MTCMKAALLYAILALGWVVRRLPVRGRVRLARFIARVAPEGLVVYLDQWGYWRAARLRDELEAQSFVGAYPLASMVAQRIAPEDWVVDAGASVGALTAHFCRLVGPQGCVWAVEPVPDNVSRLDRLKDLNGLDSLVVFAGALGATSGSFPLRLPADRLSGHASFTKSWDMGPAIEVPTWSLDALVYAEPRGRRIALLKIDVEGYEPQVLEGARRTLQDMKPLIMCEFNDPLLRDAGSSARGLLQLFASYGYEPVGEVGELDGTVTDLLLQPVEGH